MCGRSGASSSSSSSLTAKCLICTKSISSSSRRFGTRACGACAAFFSRSISLQITFICEGSNQCLRVPSLLGRNCRRCRFDKCIEIGMSNHELNPNAPPPPPPPADLPEPPTSTPSTSNNNMNINVLSDDCSIYVKIIDQVYLSSMGTPKYLETYLLGINGDIFNQPFNSLSTIPMKYFEERLYSLTLLLKKSPINDLEFPVFLYLCLCKINFPHLSFNEQIHLKNLQILCEQNFDPKIVFGQRLIELSNLAQNFYNVFKAFI